METIFLSTSLYMAVACNMTEFECATSFWPMGCVDGKKVFIFFLVMVLCQAYALSRSFCRSTKTCI